MNSEWKGKNEEKKKKKSFIVRQTWNMFIKINKDFNGFCCVHRRPIHATTNEKIYTYFFGVAIKIRFIYSLEVDLLICVVTEIRQKTMTKVNWWHSERGACI